MSIEKMRQEFEAWAVASAWLGLGEESQLHQNAEGSGYNEIEVHTAWLAWQASRETLLIELPKPESEEGESWDGCWKYGVKQCREAIESAGVKVKP
jgi:hypothetical protein